MPPFVLIPLKAYRFHDLLQILAVFSAFRRILRAGKRGSAIHGVKRTRHRNVLSFKVGQRDIHALSVHVRMPERCHLGHVRRSGHKIIVRHDLPEFLLRTDRPIGIPHLYPITGGFKKFFCFDQKLCRVRIDPAFAGLVDLLTGKIVRSGIPKIDDEIRIDIQQSN